MRCCIIKSHTGTALNQVGELAGTFEFFVHRLMLVLARFAK